MDFSLTFKILERTKVSEKDVCDAMSDFMVENNGIDGIYKVQSEEIMRFLKRKSNVIDDEDNIIEEMKEL